MAAKILVQTRINNMLVWHLSGCGFSKDGIQFKVIGSESTGPGIYDVTHTIKNVQKATYAYINMHNLIEILQTCE
jgi:hypothetical protein